MKIARHAFIRLYIPVSGILAPRHLRHPALRFERCNCLLNSQGGVVGLRLRKKRCEVVNKMSAELKGNVLLTPYQLESLPQRSNKALKKRASLMQYCSQVQAGD